VEFVRLVSDTILRKNPSPVPKEGNSEGPTGGKSAEKPKAEAYREI